MNSGLIDCDYSEMIADELTTPVPRGILFKFGKFIGTV